MAIDRNLSKNVKALIGAGASALAIAGALVGYFEGRRLVPYQDATGIWTVCEGHTGPDVTPAKKYTNAECDALTAGDMATAQRAVHRLVTVPMSVGQEAALIDFAFNKGEGALASSTLLKLTNAGQEAAACQEYHRWVYAGGRRLQGLANRAEADAWVCSLS